MLARVRRPTWLRALTVSSCAPQQLPAAAKAAAAAALHAVHSPGAALQLHRGLHCWQSPCCASHPPGDGGGQPVPEHEFHAAADACLEELGTAVEVSCRVLWRRCCQQSQLHEAHLTPLLCPCCAPRQEYVESRDLDSSDVALAVRSRHHVASLVPPLTPSRSPFALRLSSKGCSPSAWAQTGAPLW